jgi:hypothetical protein
MCRRAERPHARTLSTSEGRRGTRNVSQWCGWPVQRSGVARFPVRRSYEIPGSATGQQCDAANRRCKSLFILGHANVQGMRRTHRVDIDTFADLISALVIRHARRALQAHDARYPGASVKWESSARYRVDPTRTNGVIRSHASVSATLSSSMRCRPLTRRPVSKIGRAPPPGSSTASSITGRPANRVTSAA